MSRAQNARRVPRLYFSFRSPYSWMAIEQLRRRLPGLFGQVELFPFWDPDAQTAALVTELGGELPYQPMSKAKHLYVLADTKRLAARLGLPMAWPVDVGPWWERPHLGWLAARRAGTAEACYDALIAARWSRGENICDAGVFARVIRDAGLDHAALAAAADAADIRDEGARCLVAAWEDDIFGVPYARLGRERFWGLDRMGMFLERFLPCGEPAPGAAMAPDAEPLAGVPAGIAVGSYDRDTAGGCG